MTYTLRPYQQQCSDKMLWSLQLPGNGLVSLPTGGGKSLVIADFVHRADLDALILAPSREILAQNKAKLTHYVPEWEIGTYSASFNSKQIRRFTFATIGSVYKKPHLFWRFGLFLIDEVHSLNPKNDQSMFTSFIKAVNAIRKDKELPEVKIIGLTASPWRNVTGYHKDKKGNLYSSVTLKLLNRMKPKIWDRILYNVNIEDLIFAGYLSNMIYDDCSFIDHADIPLNVSRSDFNLNVFVDKLETNLPFLLSRIEQAEREHKSVLVFCASVQQAKDMCRLVPGSAWVSGETPTHERDRIIEAFKAGRIQTVFNMGVLTTGFDHPALDCIVLLRPTKSLGLYYQIVGRGTRIAPGKRGCHVIDFSGTVRSMGAIETIRLVKEEQPDNGFKHPVWELYCGGNLPQHRWHNRPLYEYQVGQKTERVGLFNLGKARW